MEQNSIYSHSKKEINFTAYVLACYCTPTLLKVKPASLININKNEIPEKVPFIKQIRHEMIPFEGSIHILFEDESRYLILIYNQNLLYQVLHKEETMRYLKSRGYRVDHVNQCLKQLTINYNHYKKNKTYFPHEIGVFLGYPLHDVQDFIKNSGRNYILCGCWKVYHNAEKATSLFHLFHMLRTEAVHMILEGRELREINKINPVSNGLMGPFMRPG